LRQPPRSPDAGSERGSTRNGFDSSTHTVSIPLTLKKNARAAIAGQRAVRSRSSHPSVIQIVMRHSSIERRYPGTWQQFRWHWKIR